MKFENFEIITKALAGFVLLFFLYKLLCKICENIMKIKKPKESQEYLNKKIESERIKRTLELYYKTNTGRDTYD